ncbi:hypothetical protein D9M68_794610 [compost metagenome]
MAGVAFLQELSLGGHGPIELDAHESRITANADAGLRIERHNVSGLAIALGLDGGDAGAFGQLVDDILRQCRGHALPGLRHQIDEELLAGFNAVEIECGAQTQAKAHAIGIDAGDRKIGRHGGADIGEDDLDLFLELDGKDTILNAHRIFGEAVAAGKAQDEPGIAVFLGRKELALLLRQSRRDHA